jgi:membrane protease YdiL (CAAX protease family)
LEKEALMTTGQTSVLDNQKFNLDQDLQSIELPARSIRYFILTFILSWCIWIPLVVLRFRPGSFSLSETAYSLLSFLGVLMPAIAALLLSAREKQTRSLLARLTIWRVSWKWWAAAVLVQPVLLLLASQVYLLLYGKEAVQLLEQPAAGMMLVSMVFLLLATLGEEIGWRGIGLPALELRHSALTASVILAMIYLAWHIPYWLIVGAHDRGGLFYILLNMLFAFPMTIYVTWFFNRSRFSILLPVAFHVTFNIVNVSIFPVTANVTAYEILIAFEWIIAVLLVPVLKSEYITPRREQ